MTENKNLTVLVITGKLNEDWTDRTGEEVYIEASHFGDHLNGALYSQATLREFDVEDVDYTDPALVGWDFLSLTYDIREVVIQKTGGMLSREFAEDIGREVHNAVVKMMENRRISLEIDNERLKREKQALVEDRLDSTARLEVATEFYNEFERRVADLRREHAGSELAKGARRAALIASQVLAELEEEAEQ